MIKGINDFNNVFFIGIAGTGMSAIAQYLAGIGKNVSGSDRYFKPGEENDTRNKLQKMSISCFLQDGEGITNATDLVVVSTAVEDTVAEVQKAKSLGIPILKRSELLALIAESKRTIAIGGTSGKSTTTAMLYDIMEAAGMKPSVISGAGLVSIIKTGRIGNAIVGDESQGAAGWLIIEADESDGSIVQYKPEVGLLLNVDKDHQEMNELLIIFSTFKYNTKKLFIVNQDNNTAAHLSQRIEQDFSTKEKSAAGYIAKDFKQEGLKISFTVKDQAFHLNTLGAHNMENALAAIAVANQLGVSMQTCAEALSRYEGIYRRHQLLGIQNGIYVIDDYAHNPVKCAASIKACQPVAAKVIAWFQPHGYGPTRFLKDDFIKEITEALRPQDEIWMSEIFYAGGTAVKDISANDLIDGIRQAGKNAFFVEDRNDFFQSVRSHFTNDAVLLLMGARDPGLEAFSNNTWKQVNEML
ncbi:MAG: Mur ligase domain-containing protein [Ferruginibacter sp.]